MTNPLAYNPRSQQEACGSVPTDSELSQAYQQGYQDGRRCLIDILTANLVAWDGEEDSVKQEHADLITDTRAALARESEQEKPRKELFINPCPACGMYHSPWCGLQL